MKQCRAVGGGSIIRVVDDGVILTHTRPDAYSEDTEFCPHCETEMLVTDPVRTWRIVDNKRGWWLISSKQCTNKKMVWNEFGKKVPACKYTEIVAQEYMEPQPPPPDTGGLPVMQKIIAQEGRGIYMAKKKEKVRTEKAIVQSKYTPIQLVTLFNRCIKNEDNTKPENITKVAVEIGMAPATAHTYVHRERKRRDKTRKYTRSGTVKPKPSVPMKKEDLGLGSESSTLLSISPTPQPTVTAPSIQPKEKQPEQPDDPLNKGGCITCYFYRNKVCRYESPKVILSIHPGTGSPSAGHPSRYPTPPDLEGCGKWLPKSSKGTSTT